MEALKKVIESALRACKKKGRLKFAAMPEIVLEKPKREEHGDLATNVALTLAGEEGRPPREVAADIVGEIPSPGDLVSSVSIAGPGFINFKINQRFFLGVLSEIYKAGERYGASKLGGGRRVQVEFVSANPTGPLHVGHGRGAVYGDALASILKEAGYKVTREYYLNDAGVQMETLGRSVWLRMRELQGEVIEFPEECYQGEYIKDIARELVATRDEGRGMKDDKDVIAFCSQYAGEKILNGIIKDMEDCGVRHDTYFKESTLYKKGEVDKTIEFLMKRGEAYENEGAVWFRSTRYGDEKDRVLKKSDGTYTYFAADIAYHKDKFDRGFERVIDVWGADHAGHVPRMKAAIQAIGRDPKAFDAVLIQLVNLIRKGETISMSTRQAKYETLRALLDEAGRDVCRYFFLMRSHNAQLDFDLELAKSQTMDNPVYYIQYAHARISSVFAKAPDLKRLSGADVALLNLPEEILLARLLADYPSAVEASAQELEPHKIAFYLLDLARLFQSYYTRGKKDSRYRFLSEDPEVMKAKCYLLKNIQTVLKNGLRLLGISAPERMG